MSYILKKRIEGKSVIWFKNSNRYLILENLTADIVSELNNNVSKNVLAKRLESQLKIPFEKTLEFISDIEVKILEPFIQKKVLYSRQNFILPSCYDYIKQYKIHNKIFKIHYATEYEFFLIHPKFDYLETELNSFDTSLYIFKEEAHYLLVHDNKLIGKWSKNEIHFLQGKVSMKICEHIHQKSENEWMGVFHASAVSNGKKSILFLGDSGVGKSTSLALLQANDFICLADDFVPIDSEKNEVYSFPASISVKKNSLETLLPLYPELETSAEYNFKRLNKTVRYLKPNNDNHLLHLPCKELVFIKYKKDSGLKFSKISKIEAFKKLVPDSWLSPRKDNATSFLNWFQTLNCFQITYSENQKMIETVGEIFNYEL